MASFVSIGLLALTLALCVRVILRPDLRPDRMGIIAVVCLVIALSVGGFRGLGFPIAGHLALALPLALMGPAIVVLQGFGRVDMVALLFHRDFGLKGTRLSSLKNQMATAGVVVLLIWVATLQLGWLLHAGHLVVALAALALVGLNPILRHGLTRLWLRPEPSVLLDRLVPAPDLLHRADTPDLVMIYLEGTDRRFFDPVAFPEASHRLELLAKTGIQFTRVGQMLGTGWSLAGMVASQAGIPLPPRGLRFRSDPEASAPFIPGIRFLGDLAQRRGYQTHFLVGGALEFGGIRKAYAAHGFAGLTGIDELRHMFPEGEVAAASNGWVVDDQMVLDAARQRHHAMLDNPAPFLMVVETFAPHGPKGLLSRRFCSGGRAMETHDLALAASCMVEEVTEFLIDIRAEQARRNRPLRVVLLSDHLNHAPMLATGDADYAGFNTVLFLSETADGGRIVDRNGAMIDVFPTLLDWLGWAHGPVAAGLGRSLLSPPPTLIEEFGLHRLNAMLARDAGFARAIWDETAVLLAPGQSQLEADADCRQGAEIIQCVPKRSFTMPNPSDQKVV